MANNTDYSAMSDFEINKRVAKAQGFIVQEIDDSRATGMTTRYHELRPNTVWVTDGENPWEQYCPTHSWEDAGKIIQQNRINVLSDPDNNGWYSYHQSCGDVFSGVNPLRNAMIVFLMMKGDGDE